MLITQQIKYLNDEYVYTKNPSFLSQIEQLLRSNLSEFPHDYDCTMRLALTVFAQPGGREDECAEILQQIPETSELYYKATLIEALCQKILTSILYPTYQHLLSLKSNNPELESMKYYLASNYFFCSDTNEYRKLLRLSIDLCSKHVWNLVKLGRTYKDSDTDMCKMLLCQALDNVESINPDYKANEDITDVEEFIKSHITGLCLTTSHLQSIVNDLRPFPHKMPWEK